MGAQVTALVLNTVDELIAKHEFVDALEAIRQITTDDIGSDRELLGRYYLLLGKISIGTGVNDMTPLDRALEIFRPDDLAAGQYGEARLCKGLALRRLARYPEALQEFRTAATWFNNLGSREDEARALDSIGYCCGQEGNIDGAVAAYKKAIDLFWETDSRTRARMSAVSGLARVYVNVGQLQAAKDTVTAYPISSSDVGTPMSVYYYTTLGMILTQLRQHEEAAKALNAAKAGVHKAPSLRTVYLQERGRLRYYSGEYDSALKAFKTAFDIAGEKSDMTCGLVKWMGECCLALDRANLAKAYAGHSLKLAAERGDRWTVAGSKRILAGVSGFKGDVHPARKLYRESIQEFEQIKHEYELAITRQRAARSGLFGDVQAEEWLNQTNAYFDREGVKRTNG